MTKRQKVSPEAMTQRQIVEESRARPDTPQAVELPGKRDKYTRPKIPKSLTRRIGMLKVDDRQFEMTVSFANLLPYTVYEIKEGGMATDVENFQTLRKALTRLYIRAEEATGEHL